MNPDEIEAPPVRWFVPHPTHQFNEDVRDIARQHGWRIVDARFKPADAEQPENAPELTLKSGATDAAPEQDSEANAADEEQQIAMIVDWMAEKEVTAKPAVKPLEAELSIDTNGKVIAKAYKIYQDAKAAAEADAEADSETDDDADAEDSETDTEE